MGFGADQSLALSKSPNRNLDGNLGRNHNVAYNRQQSVTV